MTDAAQDQGAVKPPRRRRVRLLIVGLAAAVLLGGGAFFLLSSEHEEPEEPSTIVVPVRKKPEPPMLGVEYHYDRNAVVDSRLVGSQIVALTAAGHLVHVDAETFKLRKERIFRRRITCLGPDDDKEVLAGISNGRIVRVAVADFAVSPVAEVPGVPRFVARRKDGGLIVGYQVDHEQVSPFVIEDMGSRKRYELGFTPVLFVDQQDRLWIGGGGKLQSVDLRTGSRQDFASKGGWAGLSGLTQLADGQIWAFGGSGKGEGATFIVGLGPGGKVLPLYPGGRRSGKALPSPISHVVEDVAGRRILAVSRQSVFVTDATVSDWKPLDAIGGDVRDQDARWALGRVHVWREGALLSLADGGFMHVTAEFSRRHAQPGQNRVIRPSSIVRLGDGMAFYGDGGPLYYEAGVWRPLPDAIMPPAELMGFARSGDKDRQWVATKTIPIEGQTSYVVTKAGPQRHYIGHIHGLRDVVLTARWDGKVLSVLGREELPIEPDDTFVTPDKQLWNVDDQGLWSFSGGHWRMVMRTSFAKEPGRKLFAAPDATAGQTQGGIHSAIGETLHFAESTRPPFYGLPTAASSWSLVRLDTNEAGGIPLIEEVQVHLDGRRLMLFDVSSWDKREELLLATDHGLCVFNVKWGTCEQQRPEGLADQVTMFMRDGTRRLWLAGKGLWVLREKKLTDAVHPHLPMLADTRVIAMAEALDGRLIIGLEDRGSVLLTIPPGWFKVQPEAATPLEAWEKNGAHEPAFVDKSLVFVECRSRMGRLPDATKQSLVRDLLSVAGSLGPRVRVEVEQVPGGEMDVALRGPDMEQLMAAASSIADKPSVKPRYGLQKRFGPRGSEAVELRSCPP